MEKYDFQIDYDRDFQNLEKHIQVSYKDSELIDFEGEQRKRILAQKDDL